MRNAACRKVVTARAGQRYMDRSRWQARKIWAASYAGEEKGERAMPIGTWGTAPGIQGGRKIFLKIPALGKEVLNVFNGRFSEAIALGIISGRQFVTYVIFLAVFCEFGSELGSAVGANGLRPAMFIEAGRELG